LCDLSLPDIGGLEVVRRLRSNPVTRRTYAVIVTALSDQEIGGFKAEADKMGIDDFISKPLTREALRTLVDTLKQQERSSPDRSRQPGKQRIRRARV
jgi:CheY-like chemotaxis protein